MSCFAYSNVPYLNPLTAKHFIDICMVHFTLVENGIWLKTKRNIKFGILFMMH